MAQITLLDRTESGLHPLPDLDLGLEPYFSGCSAWNKAPENWWPQGASSHEGRVPVFLKPSSLSGFPDKSGPRFSGKVRDPDFRTKESSYGSPAPPKLPANFLANGNWTREKLAPDWIRHHSIH